MEHASARAGAPHFSYEELAAQQSVGAIVPQRLLGIMALT
jgi:hypothetical protein